MKLHPALQFAREQPVLALGLAAVAALVGAASFPLLVGAAVSLAPIAGSAVLAALVRNRVL